MIGAVLASGGPEALEPLLDIIADSQKNWRVKVIATNTLKPLLDTEMIPKLAAMLDGGSEPTSRACAAHLLRLMGTEESAGHLRGLTDDKDRRVRLAALAAVSVQGDMDARQQLRDIFFKPDTTSAEKAEILLALASAEPMPEDIRVLTEAVIASDIKNMDKNIALAALARAGGIDTSNVLEHYAASDCPDDLREIVNMTSKAIKERIAGEDSK